jgi:protein-L-isoaspartate(D-aspartate) O-methyltransferase
MNFDALRNKMVDEQIAGRGIKDERVINAMRKIPRHKFVPESNWSEAYKDHPLPIGEGQTISQPYMVALMTESLKLTGKEKVLEIGTGSGYQSAILSELTSQVFTIERISKIAKRTRKILDELGYSNIVSKVGDGTLGWKEFSPFDRILITASAPKMPTKLFEQLSENGIMVVPIGGSWAQDLLRIKKINNKPETENICGCVFVRLIGENGWKED